ncbi:MAG TPA: TadE family protein [Nocardioidaceae bacterium]|nr:TadE family protein [Nocardioidaceae bacterium]
MTRVRGWRTGRSSDQRGVAAVEFAIVIPVLLSLVFGVISFGFVLSQKAGIANGVRSGARYGSVNLYANSHTCGNVIAETRESARTVGISSGTEVGVTVKRGTTTICSAAVGAATPSGGLPPCTNASPPSGAETLYVEASFPAQVSIPMMSFDPIDLTSVGAYQCEYS